MKKTNKTILLFIVSMFSVLFLFAQVRQIKGTVKDEKGNPVEGATIQLKNANASTITDANGVFSIEASLKSVLLITHSSFSAMEIIIDSETPAITLAYSAKELEEVVVVGYGERKKASLTSAISAVNTKELGNITFSNIGAALQGRAPGLFIRDRGYNQGLSFLIRGQTTIGNNGPLVIVDGIPFNSFNIDPNNIASISVLKDASATAIYGARAAAGVILITTKSGSKGKARITFDTYTLWGNPTDMPRAANSIESAQLMNEAASNSGASPLFTPAQIDIFKAGNNPDYPDNNWPDLLIKTERKSKYYISVNGGNDNSQYALSLSYLHSNGIFAKNVNDKQYNIQFNLSSKLRNNIDVKFFVTLNRNNSRRPSQTDMDNLYAHSLVVAPFLAIKNSDGTYAALNKAGSYSRGFWNPLWELEAGSSISQTDMSAINGSLNWELIKGLKYIVRTAIVTANGQGTSNLYSRSYTGGPPWVSDIPWLSKSTSHSQQLNAQNFLQYDKQFGDHGLSVLGGWDVEFNKSSSLSGSRQGFQFNNLLTELSAPNSGSNNDITGLGSNTSESVLQSAVGRVNYNYKSKYLLELSGRYDGSSNFAPETRYGFFPAVSAGWYLSKENFFNVNNVDHLKIRASYGTAGNNRVSGSYFALMSFGSYYFDNSTVGSTAREGSPAFRNLRWEKTTSRNIGIDFSVYKGLISGSLDIYSKTTNDILLPSPVPGTVGTNRSGPPINAGSVRNKGFELVLSHKNNIGKLAYTVSFNGAYNKSKVLELTSSFSPFSTSYRVGDEMGIIYGNVADGIFRTDADAAAYLANTVTSGLSSATSGGDIRYKDINGDKKLDFMDVVPIAKTLPRFTYGANISASLKQFDVQIFLQGVAGVKGYYSNDMFGNSSWIPKEALSGWSQKNPDGNYPRPLLYATKTYFQNFGRTSSFWAYNAAYLRVKNIQLGYNVPVRSNTIVQSARVYLAATNFLTMHNYRDGYDPESPTFSAVPTLKTFSVGLNVQF